MKAQLTQIVTNTNQKLTYLSTINESVIVGGLFDYIGKCNNNCTNLSAISIPGPGGYALNFFRRNENALYCVSYSPSKTLFYESQNNGTNWVQKLDTVGDLTRHVAFFDSSNGVMSWENSLIKTQNNGISWTSLSTPLIWPVAVSAIGVFNDSILCIGGDNGAFYLSKNMGQSWAYAWGLGTQVIKDFSFLSKDTIFTLSLYGGLSKSINGGFSWTNTTIPVYSTYGITFKDKQEGFIVGANASGYGIIAKTTDMGSSWAIFPTQVYSTFFNIELVNDSIALISGSNGILLTWNYKSTLVTGEQELEKSLLTKFYPNPTDGRINIESNGEAIMKVTDLIGKEYGIYTLEKKTNELDLTLLPKGVYLCRIEYYQKTIYCKLILK